MNHLGRTSLLVVATGSIACEALIHAGICDATALRIVAAGFEAGTVGGLADWFAVSALFRRIPIPFISRHTNIIVKNRQRITESIVDLVINQWLTRENITGKISSVDILEKVLGWYKENPRNCEIAHQTVMGAISHIAQEVNNPDLVGLLEKVMKDQLQKSDLAQPLGKWLLGALQEGKHNNVFEFVIDTLERSLNDRSMHNYLERQLDTIIKNYAEEGFFKKMAIALGELTDAIDTPVMANKILKKLQEVCDKARQNPEHPIRKKVDAVLFDFAEGLAKGRGDAVKAVENVRKSMLQNADLKGLIQKIFENFKESIAEQCQGPDTDLGRIVQGQMDTFMASLETNPEMRHRMNGSIKNVLSGMVDSLNHEIGGMVRDSMSRFDDDALVAQLKDKVWDDLQCIRLNGAVIGGCVGLIIATMKWLTS